jgi:Uncharacterized protein conserved in bacteria (DUF2252)
MEETMTVATAEPEGRPPPMRPADRRAHGKRLRDTAPRDAHPAWRGHAERADPIGILHAADAARQPDLVPLRYGRMLQSPFTFYCGSAAVMAADLVRTPVSGIRVQVCGDCHLMNFGGFCHAGAPTHLRHQRSRRDITGTLGVGPQAPRRLLCARRPCQRALRCGRP